MNNIIIWKCISCKVEIPIDYSQIPEKDRANVTPYCGCDNPKIYSNEYIEKALKELEKEEAEWQKYG